MICTSCHRGVPVDMLISHSKAHHPGRAVPTKQQSIMEGLTAQGYRTSKSAKHHQPPGQKPIDGLEVLEGFRCPLPSDDGSECFKAFIGLSTFTRHLSSHATPRGGKPDVSLCTAFVQSLFTQGGLQNYFSVDPSLSNPDPSPTSTYAYAVEMFSKLPKAEIPASNHDKDHASINWFTRWPELLKPYLTDHKSIDFLLSLVLFPDPTSDPQWLVKLCHHGRHWWREAEAAHVNCTFRTSVLLKSHEK